MRHQGHKYIQTPMSCLRNRTTTSVGASSDVCVFVEPLLATTGCTKIFTGMTSGTTCVHILTGQTTLPISFNATGNTGSVTTVDTNFRFELYKYDNNNLQFNPNRVYSSEEVVYVSGVTSDSIPVSYLALDGEYLVKPYYNFANCTDYLSRLSARTDTALFRSGNEYGIYNEDTDFYFIGLNKASTPIFSGLAYQSSENSLLQQQVIIPTEGETAFAMTNNAMGSVILTLNGLVLAKDEDYTITSNIITLNEAARKDDIISVLYTSNINNPLITDVIDVTTSITSGITDSEGVNVIYYNTTQGKFEIYTELTPLDYNNTIIMVNGVTLSKDVDYYVSKTNAKRFILTGNIVVGDIITIAYFAGTTVINEVSTPTPRISWSIAIPPKKINGEFTIELASDSDFNTIVTGVTVPYVVDVTGYSEIIPIVGNVGDKLYYRVKNTKNYITLVGDIIESVAYSETVPITVVTNSANSY